MFSSAGRVQGTGYPFSAVPTSRERLSACSGWYRTGGTASECPRLGTAGFLVFFVHIGWLLNPLSVDQSLRRGLVRRLVAPVRLSRDRFHRSPRAIGGLMAVCSLRLRRIAGHQKFQRTSDGCSVTGVDVLRELLELSL